MFVREFMTTEVMTIPPTTSVFDAKRLFHEKSFRHLPVVDDAGRLLGIVTQTDLLGASLHLAQTVGQATQYLERMRATSVERYMSANPYSVGGDEPVEGAAQLMRDHKIGCVAVVEGEKLIGILTETDIFDALVRALGLQSGEQRHVFDLEAGTDQEVVAGIVSWLLENNLSMTSLVTYRPRSEDERGKILVRASQNVPDEEEGG